MQLHISAAAYRKSRFPFPLLHTVVSCTFVSATAFEEWLNPVTLAQKVKVSAELMPTMAKLQHVPHT